MDGSRALGWIPDIPSTTDYLPDHELVAPLLAKTSVLTEARAAKGKSGRAAAPPQQLPRKVDLRGGFPPIEDQGQLGSCTANAAVGLLEYFERRAHGTHIDASRLFIYKTTRNLLGWTGDTGAYIRTAMGALVLFGAPPERYWPYDARAENQNSHFDIEPPAFCYAFGSSYQAIKYFRLDPNNGLPAQTLQNVKTYLAAGFPSMFGFPVYAEFDDPLPGGLVAYPAPRSRVRGGHAIVAAGYDDSLQIGADKGALLIRNSWGTGWGAAGYGWLSYRYVTEGLALDWWSLIKAEWVNTGNF